MCGINGFNFVDRKKAQEMNKAIVHRGPDNSQTLTNKDVSLGHQRLSIIDLSKNANQPMKYTNKKKSATIVYNGEIYNFKEIKKELASKGYKFESTSDTEVVLASYLEWGLDCVKKFNGMWSFCIYDPQKNIFFLSRDRLGQKPLYYFFDGKKFIFSSEMKAITRHNIRWKINPEGIDLYISLGFIPAPFSVYKDIFKVEASQNIIFNLKTKKLTKNHYYSPPEYKPTYNKKKLKKEFNKIFEDATKIRMIADVPVGAFLSGGLDSSAVVYQANKLSEKKLSTFSIKMKGNDDTIFSDLLKEKLNLINSKKEFTKRDFDEIRKRIYYYYDEPFADYSLFPTFFLSKIVSKKLKVALSGDGADELFGGYPHYQNLAKLSSLKKFPKVLRRLTLLATPKINKTFMLREALRISLLDSKDVFSEVWQDIYKPKIFREITQEKMKKMLKLSKGNIVEAMILFDRHFKSQGDNFLCKVDRASMANSLEVRSPFLDFRFIDFASKIPAKWKANSSNTKIFMKEVFEEVLPKKIVHRKKEGFNSELLETLIDDLYGDANLTSVAKDLCKKGIISKEWEKFYLEKAIKYKKGLFRKYRLRLFLLNEWAKFWSIK